jgi:hypothetical protein
MNVPATRSDSAGRRSRTVRTWLVTGALVGSGLCLTGVPAMADPPAAVSSSTLVKDQHSVLGSRQADVQKAIEKARTESGYTLHIVFVDKFENPSNKVEWANQTISKSSLSSKDILLAVDTTNRLAQVTVPKSSSLTSAEGTQIFTAFAQSMKSSGTTDANAWADAAIAAAGQVGQLSAAGASTGTAGTAAADATGVSLAGGAIVLAGGGGLLYWLNKRRKKKQSNGTSQGEIAPAGSQQAIPAGLSALSTEELRTRAGQDILLADDAVHAAEQEIEFARLQFGDEEVAPMQQAIADAKTKMQQAYTCQQQLDDDIPDTEEQTRSWLIEIISLSGAVTQTLAQQQEGFERLRSMETDIEKTLTVFTARSQKQRGRLGQAQATVESTASRFSQQAVLRVADNATQAKERLDFVDSSVAQANELIAQGNRSQAVVISRPLDEAIKQATSLLDQIDQTSRELTQLDARLDRSLADAKSDAAQANAFLPQARTGQAELAAAHAALVETIGLVETERARGHYDPIDLSERLDVARDRASHAMASSSEAEAAKEQARQELDRTLARAQRRVDAARDFIEARRGGVGAQARTRLSEAMRTFDDALARRANDPVGALDLAQQSLRLADESLQLADQDVNNFQQQASAGYGGGFGGAYGNPYGQRSSGMGGALLGGLVLGGLLDNVFGGGHHGDGGFSGGGFGGGGFDGGFGGGGGIDIGGGDFGGGGDF